MTEASAPETSALAGLSRLVERTRPAAALDQIDRDLLAALAEDPPVSQRRLAKQIGMSAPAIGERIARLERMGVIRGYSVDIDWGAIGLPLLVYIPITIASGTETHAVVERLRDHAHLQELLLDQLYIINGLTRFETFISLGAVPVGATIDKILAGRSA